MFVKKWPASLPRLNQVLLSLAPGTGNTCRPHAPTPPGRGPQAGPARRRRRRSSRPHAFRGPGRAGNQRFPPLAPGAAREVYMYCFPFLSRRSPCSRKASFGVPAYLPSQARLRGRKAVFLRSPGGCYRRRRLAAVVVLVFRRLVVVLVVVVVVAAAFRSPATPLGGRPVGQLEAGISLCTACGPARARAGPLARGPSAAQGVHKVIFCFPALGSVARRAPLMRWLCPVAAGLRQGDCHLVWGARPVRVAAGPLCRESCAPTFSLPARRMSL